MEGKARGRPEGAAAPPTVSGKRVQDFQQSLKGAPHPQKVKLHWSGAELTPWAKTGLPPESSVFPQTSCLLSPGTLSLCSREAGGSLPGLGPAA